MATGASLAPDLNASASLSSSSSSLQNGANGALRDEVKRLSQRVGVLTSEKAVLTEQQAQLLGEAEMPTNLERESARTTMPTNLEHESARTTLVQKESPRRRTSAATTFAWGRNTHGQLGVDGGGEAAVSSIDNLPTAKAIACSHFHTLALDMSGNVYSWGRGALGLLGQGCELDLAAPRRIDELKAIVAVGAGPYQSAAVDAGGSVLVWGWALDADGVAETYHMRPVPQRGLPPTAGPVLVDVLVGSAAASSIGSPGPCAPQSQIPCTAGRNLGANGFDRSTVPTHQCGPTDVPAPTVALAMKRNGASASVRFDSGKASCHSTLVRLG